LTLYIQQKVRRGKIEQRLKTANAVRQVDLHPAIAPRLEQFVGRGKLGLLFCTRTGKPLSPTNMIRRHLHVALKELNYTNPYTGTHKAGNQCGFGFELPSVVPNVPKVVQKSASAKAA
jgi:hypothetical protein